ncbi:hypothetical protein QL285_027177 [Trifolium repens]|nr:hypothetical protein QL285_027177 [Trifolium repens]
MYKRVKINLAKILFDHLCSTISKSRTKSTSVIHHPRLISEIIRQTKLVDILSTKEKIRVFNTAKFDATVLVNMKKKTKEEIKQAKTPLQAVYEEYFWCDGFPTISEHDNNAVIKNFLELVRIDTGISVPRSMVVGVPNWDIFKGPKEITRSKRKPKPIEQEIVEEGSQAQPENDAEQMNSGAKGLATEGNEQVPEGQLASISERSAAEEKARMEAKAAERALQKEKRTKKRHDRPSASEKDQNPAKPTKRLKARASKPPGKSSKSNTCSILVAQDSNSQIPPSIPLQQTKSAIDEIKPISMILPHQTTATTCFSLSSSSSSFSSEGTPSDYSTDIAAVIRKSTRHLNKIKLKTAKETINISPEENIHINTSYLDQENIAINPDSLDHLTSHLSGDAFMHSNLNSPNHPINKFVSTIIEEPQMTPPQASHVNVNASEQVKPPTPTHYELQIQSPHHSLVNDIAEQQPPSPPPEVYTPEPSPEPSPKPIYGPLNKPLDEEELAELVDSIFKAEEQILKDAIEIDDEPPNLSRIKIINLKRKKPEPTIPFDPSKPFVNSASEPNLELLNNAISLRLKRFKQMEEEVLIFPSDIDAEIRKMEYLFGQSLRILGTHLKSKIQGRGATTLRCLFDIAERSNAPRLTWYNHEEEIARLAALDAEIKKLAKSAFETAQKLLREEAEYLKLVEAEQARIAAEAEQKRLAEIEHKRLADQEAFNLLVNMGVHIATIETNKIKENKTAKDIEMFEQIHFEEDIEMPDQNQAGEASDKGNVPIIDKTPPASPKLEPGSSSSAIPPAIQSALDNIRNELAEEIKDEIDVLRVDLRNDLRSDITASEQATHKRMNAMMETLLNAIADIKKP